MCLVASSWWSYWSTYAGLTKEDVLRVPERLALGLHKTEDYLDQAPADVLGVHAKGRDTTGTGKWVRATKATPERAAGGGGATSGAINSGGNGNGCAAREAQAAESLGGAGKEKAVPTMLARRPHEIDNSSLQVRSEG